MTTPPGGSVDSREGGAADAPARSLADLEVELARSGGDPVRALRLAIAAWRDTRANELADLVDSLAGRCPAPVPPRSKTAIHAWWMGRALAYDPCDAVVLAKTMWLRCTTGDAFWADVRARWEGTGNAVLDAVGVPLGPSLPTPSPSLPPVEPEYVANWIDRLAALFAWPDDPRLGPILVELLMRPGLHVRRERSAALAEAIADRIIELGDRRIVPRLAAYIHEPRGASPDERAQQSRIAARIVEALTAEARPVSGEDAAAIARCVAVAAPPPAPHSEDLEALWREIAERPDDLEPRLVLADALTELGDTRGEAIVLQCRPEPDLPIRGEVGRAKSQLHRLLRTEWDRWFGDLALVLARSRSELRRGMLEVACIGKYGTPPWAWEAVRGHRELAAVHTVLAGHVTPEHFAAFVGALPRFPRELEIDAPEVVDELARLHPRLPVERITYAMTSSTTPHRRTWPPFALTFEQLAQLAPDLRVVDFGAMWSARFGAQVRDLIPQLPVLFRHLERVRVARPTLQNIPDDPEALGRIQALPFVELY